MDRTLGKTYSAIEERPAQTVRPKDHGKTTTGGSYNCISVNPFPRLLLRSNDQKPILPDLHRNVVFVVDVHLVIGVKSIMEGGGGSPESRHF